MVYPLQMCELSVETATRTLKCSMAYGGLQSPLYKI